MKDDADLTLVVAELDCADEATQIEGALGRLAAVRQVRTAVGAHKVFVTYDPARIEPAAIRMAVEQLGMTVREGRRPVVRRRASLTRLAGGLFVTVVALVALVGILGERLDPAEPLVHRGLQCGRRPARGAGLAPADRRRRRAVAARRGRHAQLLTAPQGKPLTRGLTLRAVLVLAA